MRLLRSSIADARSWAASSPRCWRRRARTLAQRRCTLRRAQGPRPWRSVGFRATSAGTCKHEASYAGATPRAQSCSARGEAGVRGACGAGKAWVSVAVLTELRRRRKRCRGAGWVSSRSSLLQTLHWPHRSHRAHTQGQASAGPHRAARGSAPAQAVYVTAQGTAHGTAHRAGKKKTPQQSGAFRAGIGGAEQGYAWSQACALRRAAKIPWNFQRRSNRRKAPVCALACQSMA